MKIFLIAGKAQCGKNTFGDYLKEELKDYGYKPCIMHITEPLYSYARTYFEWNPQENNKPREFLQKMGIDIIKKQLGKDNFLLNRLYEDIEILSNFFDVFIITDARLIKEFEEIKNKYKNVVLIKLERHNYDDKLTDIERKHITENELDNYDKFDYIIENKSLKELKNEAIELIRNEEISGGSYE